MTHWERYPPFAHNSPNPNKHESGWVIPFETVIAHLPDTRSAGSLSVEGALLVLNKPPKRKEKAIIRSSSLIPSS
jgi:hypothetical protein